MLKNYIVAGLIAGLIATNAYAEKEGVSSGEGTSFSNRADACSDAKTKADFNAKVDSGSLYSLPVTGHSKCDCSSSKSGVLTQWTCTVDAQWKLK